MRKELRACMEARDVFHARRLRQRDGVVVDFFEELQVSSVIGRTIMGMGLVEEDDVRRLLRASHVVAGEVVRDEGGMAAFRDKVWSRMEALSPPLRGVEVAVARSSLRYVGDLFAEIGFVTVLMDMVEGDDGGKLPHERHHDQLRRFHARAGQRHLRSLAMVYGAGVVSELERRVRSMRSVAKWLRKQGGFKVPLDARGDAEEGDALAAAE